MGIYGLKIICFYGRYYIYFNYYNSYLEDLGEHIVADIPTSYEDYQHIYLTLTLPLYKSYACIVTPD